MAVNSINTLFYFMSSIGSLDAVFVDWVPMFLLAQYFVFLSNCFLFRKKLFLLNSLIVCLLCLFLSVLIVFILSFKFPNVICCYAIFSLMTLIKFNPSL